MKRYTQINMCGVNMFKDRRIDKLQSVLVLLVILLAFFNSMLIASAAGSETISISSAWEVNPGDTVVLPITLADVTDVTGVDVTVVYDTNIVTIQDVVANSSVPGSSVYLNIDNEVGKTKIAFINTDYVTATSAVPIIDITFEVVGSSGSSTIELQEVEFGDSSFDVYVPGTINNGGVTASLPNLVFAITPNSRLAQVGTPVTIFMSVINAGTGSATDVSISQASSLPATISYQAWNGVTLTGTPDTPMDIGPGETVNYVLVIDATAEFVSSAMTFDVSGTNSGSAPISGVNTLTMAASTTPYADVIMMSTSLDVSTAVNTPTAFALATTNVGTASATDVSLIVEVPTSITGLAYQVNETNLDGSIKGPATGLTIPVGGSPTFAVFLTPTQAIDFDPANNRLMLKLVDGSGKVVGAQSVAVSTV